MWLDRTKKTENRFIGDMFSGNRITEKKEITMIDYLTHAYKIGTEPFQNIMNLYENEALKIMKEQYVEGSLFWDRFSDPEAYWTARKDVENWLYTDFITKDGAPEQTCPVYMVVGSPKWVERNIDIQTKRMTREIRIPLSLFGEYDISFTYPDSMVSWHLSKVQDSVQYQPEYHGVVFTLSEMLAIISRMGLPDEGWGTNVPDQYAHYIEAQVWNLDLLRDYRVGSP